MQLYERLHTISYRRIYVDIKIVDGSICLSLSLRQGKLQILDLSSLRQRRLGSCVR
jgi:hypothetical protein